MAFSALFKRISIPVLIGAAVIFGVTYWFDHFSSEGKRRARVEAARVHAQTVVAPLLAKQKRFDCVRVSEWWKDDGYFYVRGAVDSEVDLRDLRQLVIATHPPAPIAWDVEVAETNTATNGLSR